MEAEKKIHYYWAAILDFLQKNKSIAVYWPFYFEIGVPWVCGYLNIKLFKITQIRTNLGFLSNFIPIFCVAFSLMKSILKVSFK